MDRGLLTWLAAGAVAMASGAISEASPQSVRAARPSAWTTTCVIPWGSGAGRLKEEIHSTDERQTYRGPTRFLAFDGGRFVILDTLGSAVKEFDESGQMMRSFGYPANDEHDSETLGIDLAAPGFGDYRVLSLGQQAVLSLRGDGTFQEHKIPGITRQTLLWGLTSDAQGNLFVLDANDNSVLWMSPAGKPLPRTKSDVAASLTVDRKGRFYNLRLVGKSDARTYELVRWTPGAEPEVFGKIQSDLEINHIDVFGVDRAGNVYVYLGSGAIENPSRVEVARFAPDGKETGRVACPLDPVELKFQHAKAVSPDGTVYSVVVTKAGLAVLKLRGW